MTLQPHLHPRVRRYAALIGATLWVVSLINCARPGPTGFNGHNKGEDFVHFYVLGQIAADRAAADLYDAGAQQRRLLETVKAADPVWCVPAYGPQVALLMRPFALLPYLASLVLWVALSIVAVVLSVRAVARALPVASSLGRDVTILALAAPALWQLGLNGQTTALAVAAVVCGWMLLKRDSDSLAGACLGVLFYKPQFLLAVVVAVLALRRWRAALAICVSCALQLLVAAWYFGTASLAAYAKSLVALATNGTAIEPKPYLLHSYRSVFEMLPLPPTVAALLSLTCSVALLVFLARSVARYRDVDTAFAMALPATVLVGVHASVYDLVLLLPSLVVGLDRLLATPPESSIRRVGAVILIACYVLPAWSTAALWLVVQPMAILMTALVVWICRAADWPDTRYRRSLLTQCLTSGEQQA